MKKKPRRLYRDPLLLEIAAAVGAGNIEIGPIHDDETFVHGLAYKNGKIVINPAIDVVDTLLHECCHRLRPEWSERAVRTRVTRLMRQLSDKEIDKMYELVLVAAQAAKAAQ